MTQHKEPPYDEPVETTFEDGFVVHRHNSFLSGFAKHSPGLPCALCDTAAVDSVVEAVRADLLRRSQLGIKKYRVTLDRTDLSPKDWLQHAYEECLDQANYLKRVILTLEQGDGTPIVVEIARFLNAADEQHGFNFEEYRSLLARAREEIFLAILRGARGKPYIHESPKEQP